MERIGLQNVTKDAFTLDTQDSLLSLIHIWGQCHIFQHRQVGEHVEMLEHHADALAVLGDVQLLVGDVPVSYTHLRGEFTTLSTVSDPVPLLRQGYTVQCEALGGEELPFPPFVY